MKLIRSILVLVSLAVAVPVAAQEPARPGSNIKRADSLEFKLSPELQKSLDELAIAIQALALRIANDPQVRAAAMQVASGVVVTAQQVVTEQSVVLQEALKMAAEKIAIAQITEKRQLKRAP